MMLKTKCHCDNIKIQANSFPSSVTACNCSICRRTAALWAYYDATDIKVENITYPISTYRWGSERVTLHSCSNCGNVMYHSCMDKGGILRVGVNARMAEPELSTNTPIRILDGADTWKYLNE
jgi:hypothetical protein